MHTNLAVYRASRLHCISRGAVTTEVDVPKLLFSVPGFKIKFPCTGAITTEVDVNIQMNISIFSASNVTVLDFRRKKFCTKGRLTAITPILDVQL